MHSSRELAPRRRSRRARTMRRGVEGRARARCGLRRRLRRVRCVASDRRRRKRAERARGAHAREHSLRSRSRARGADRGGEGGEASAPRAHGDAARRRRGTRVREDDVRCGSHSRIRPLVSDGI